MKLTQKQLDKIKEKYNLVGRELEIVKLIFDHIEAEKEIGKKLNIAEGTVEVHLQRIYNKTGFRKKISLVLNIIDMLDLHGLLSHK